VTSGWTHRHQLGAGFHLLDHLSWWWLVAGFVCEGASLAPAGLLQRHLLRAGHVNISAVDVTKISVAANAMSVSLPAGGAWSATWSWKALRRHGAEGALAAWVVVVAGAVSSFALFVLAVAGAELAGNHGPVASLRWPARALAGIGAGGFLLILATRARRNRRSHPGRALARLLDRTRVVRLSPSAWAAAFGLALANWLLDLACLVACIAAVGADIDWRRVLVIYALAQMIAALPLTPGGLGVVEAGLAALLVRYGTAMPSAIATVLVYRTLTFWPLVPAGWIVWWRLDKARPAVGPPGHPRGQKPTITRAGITHEISSSIPDQFRQRLLPDMGFKAVPLMVPTPGTPTQTPTPVLCE
jgi:uncharacterized membrane protein YbhN (UPF0104 family)